MSPGAFPDPPTKTLRLTSFIYSIILLQNCKFTFTNAVLQMHYEHISRPVERLSLFILTPLQVRISRTDWMEQKKPPQISSAFISAVDSLQLVFTHSAFHTLQVVFFACECERCHVKLTHVQTCTCQGENAERGLRNGIQLFKKNIFIILLRVCMCCRGQRLMRQSQSSPCREVRRHLFFEWFWLGSAAGWCNSRKYRPWAVLTAVSVHE